MVQLVVQQLYMTEFNYTRVHITNWYPLDELWSSLNDLKKNILCFQTPRINTKSELHSDMHLLLKLHSTIHVN